MNDVIVSVSEKYALTVVEAAEYFNIGEKKLRWIIDEYEGEDFLLSNGRKTLFKRQKFSDWLDAVTAI